LGRGGAEMLLPETLRLHDRQNFEFHYIYFLPWKNQLEETIRSTGGIVHCFRASNNIKIILQAKRVLRYIRENNIDVVHCHLPWAGFLGRLIYKLSDIPVIYSEHNKQERYHGVTFFLNKLTFNWQTKAIAVSADVEDSIRRNINPKIPVQVILNGVNTSRFQRDAVAGKELRRSLGISEQALVVGTIAVFRFQKRLVEWLEVASEIVKQIDNVHFIIVGDGPLKDDILAKRRELNLEDRVTMGGLQTEVRPWLSAMDVYMMSSVFEGLPIALLEAMSMECAIVSTDAGGIKEVIRNNRDGLIVDVERYRDLPDRVAALRSEPDRRRFAIQARRRVEESFSLQTMVQELETLYLQLKGSDRK
jgi:glycosyltransferase involved in cell wall biosynthesis